MTESEMNDGSRVLIGYNVGNVGDTYILAGEEFEVIGVLNTAFNPDDVNLHIPLSSVNEEFTSGFVSLFFAKLPTKADYDTFVTVLRSHYGDNVQFSDFEPMNVDDIIAYNSIIILALAIGVVAALDTILVYNYLMKKRKKQMAIFGIEGAKRIHQILINETEVLIITVLTAVTGVTVFRLVIEKILMEVYEIGIPIFSVKVYGIMLLAYIGCIFMGTLVMTVINSRKKVLDMRRG
jgi:ABC-type antimicrobial peptide transport system permease subunit